LANTEASIGLAMGPSLETREAEDVLRSTRPGAG